MLDVPQLTPSSQNLPTIDVQQSLPDHFTASLPLAQRSVATETEIFEEPNVFKGFFNAMQQPALIVDLNVNHEKARPDILNQAAITLLANSLNDMFTQSHLESFDGSLTEFIQSTRQKAAQHIIHADTFYIAVHDNDKISECKYSLKASTYELSNDMKILGITLMEISKIEKNDIDAIDSFKSSLISALSHELNTPMNSLIPLLRMMPSCKNKESNQDIKEMALSSAILLNNKIRDFIDYTRNVMKDFKLVNTEFCVNDLFSDLHRLFKVEMSQKSNTLVARISTGNGKKLQIFGD